jgi:hypothetical protein
MVHLFKSLIKPRILLFLLPIVFYVCTSGRLDYDYYDDIYDDYNEDKDDYVAIKHNARWLLLSLSFPLLFLWTFILDKFKIEESSVIFSVPARIVSIILLISMIVSVFPLMIGIFWLILGCPEGYWE